MDPFSIAAGTAGVIDIAVRLGKYIRDFLEASSRVHTDLKALLDEFETLLALSKAAQSICTPELLQSPGMSKDDHDRLKGLWTVTLKTFDSCRQILEKLYNLVTGILGKERREIDGGDSGQPLNAANHSSRLQRFSHSASKKFEDFSLQLRRQKKDEEFQRLRQELGARQDALQTSLEMINLWFSTKSANMTGASLDRLHERVEDLSQILQSKLSMLQHEPHPTWDFKNKHYQAPAAIDLYTGREALLTEVKAAFGLDSTAIETAEDSDSASVFSSTTLVDDSSQLDTDVVIHKRFVLHGLGGAGKTEFCRKFAERNKNRFWGIFWIDASSDQNAQQSFKNIANIGGVDPNLNAAKSWLSSLEFPWLLVIDNADDPAIPVDNYFPGGETKGHILITTRDPSLARLGNVGRGFCHLETLADDEAISLLLKAAEVSSRSRDTLALAANIANVLGYLPLALFHGGRAIAIGTTTMEDFVEYFNDHWEQVRRAARQHGREIDDTNKNIFGPYDMKYRHLEEQHTQATDDSIELLRLFSFLYFENIRLDFLTTAAGNPWQYEKEKREDIKANEAREFAQYTIQKPLKWTEKVIEWLGGCYLAYKDYTYPAHLPNVLRHRKLEPFSIHRLRQALTILTKTSLITNRRSDNISVYSMHPLVHRWVRERPQAHFSEQGIWCQAANTLLMQSIHLPPLGDTETERNLRIQLLAHVDHMQKCEKEFQASLHRRSQMRRTSYFLTRSLPMDLKKALQAGKYSRVYAEGGRFEDAAQLQEQVKSFLESWLGHEDLRMLDIIQGLAGSYWLMTRLNDALELQKKGLDICEKSLGSLHPRTLRMMDQLGKSQTFRGRFREALKLHGDALAGMKKTIGPKHPDTLKTMANLGETLARYFRWGEARELQSEAYNGLKDTLGPTHEDTLSAMESLAMSKMEPYENHLVGDQEELNSAREMLVFVLNERRRILGKESPYTLWTICNLARVKAAIGETIEAEADMRATLPIAIRNLGPNHLGTLMGWTHLATVLMRQERYTDAEKIFLDVIDRSLYNSGAREEGDHPDRIFAEWCCVECYRLQGRYAEALKQCDDILESLLKMPYGELHPLAHRVKQKQEVLRAAGEQGTATSRVTEKLPLRERKEELYKIGEAADMNTETTARPAAGGKDWSEKARVDG